MMKRLAVLGLSAAGCFILVGVIVSVWFFHSPDSSGSQNAAPEKSTVTKTENGLKLTADLSDTVLEPGDVLQVKASVENVSGKPLHYYMCTGIPVRISASALDESFSLLTGDRGEGCAEVYDPDAVKVFEDGDVIKKEATIYPEIPVNNHDSFDAPQGEYRLTIEFRTQEDNVVRGEKRIEVQKTDTPIISKEKAVQAANEHPDVQKWMNEQEAEGIEVIAEEHFLSDFKWVIMYHTEAFLPQSDDPDGKRIVIHVNAKTGEVQETFQEDYSTDTSSA